MKVVVVGTGYVGLVTGTVLSYIGHDVVCVDIDTSKIDQLQAGRSPIFEPGLEELIKAGLTAGRLSFSSNYGGVASADLVFITVGTPPAETGGVDLSDIKTAATETGKHLAKNRLQVIVNKSTVPVGSGNWVEMLVSRGIHDALAGETEHNNSAHFDPSRVGYDFVVVSNPEFLREGSAVYDSFFPDRVVIGSSDRRAQEVMRELYEPILEQSFTCPDFLKPHERRPASLVITDLASAEMIKYTANAFLATKISFANEIAAICASVGADVTEVMRGVGLDRRIGREFLNAGIGWGGSCFGKDLSALIATADEYGVQTTILRAAGDVNRAQRWLVIKKLQEALKILKGRTVGLLGLAFKPNTDDVRDAPSLDIAEQVLKLGGVVKAYDPVAEASARRARPDLEIIYCSSASDVAEGSDALVIVTEWDEFARVDLHALRKLVRTPVLIDGRNVLNRDAAVSAGFEYYGIGR